MTDKNINLEKSLTDLEALVAELEGGDLSLEDAMKKFEHGIKLTRACQLALKEAEQRVDIVILTGGLGPTKDDITKHTIASYFNDHLELNNDVVTHIKELFQKYKIPFGESNRLQGMLPTKASVLKNLYGTAPGMWFYENNTVFVSLPGVPNEMKGLMKYEVLPKIQKQCKLPFILHKTIMTYGQGESVVAERIETFENNL